MIRRDWRVRVGGIDVSGLDFRATIEKSLRPEPNKCVVEVMNLSAESRRALESMSIYDPKRVRGSRSSTVSNKTPKTGKIRVEIEAGYQDTGRSLLFVGDLRRALSKHEEADWTTTIEGEDGGRAVLASRVKQSFPPGTTRAAVVQACAEALGVGLGNIAEVAPQLAQVYTAGTTINGSAAEELKGVLRRAEIAYSIQNGNLQFLSVGRGRQVEAFLVSPTTGLVGSPERDVSGMVVIKTLLLPNIAPGGYVSLKSSSGDGVYRIQRVEYSLDSAGQDWYATCECLPG